MLLDKKRESEKREIVILNTIHQTAAAPLRSGYTTGACAAAAAKGAALMLARQEKVRAVTIDLPAGVSATFLLHGQTISTDSASCYVVKDAGDDPDITNGAEVHALVALTPPLSPGESGNDIIITGGAGIGKVTKPGLAVPPGEWAINPVPRRMITESVSDVFPPDSSLFTLHVTISIPDGEQRALKTLNARLGIIGGLSILGTSGIVRPISAKAWTDTIDAALNVARACGCETVVLSTGRTSELAAQKLSNVKCSKFKVEHQDPNLEHRTPNLDPLPEEAYVMMGDHIAHALRACQLNGFDRPVIACQFAKLLKIACGHENTHAAASELDLANLHNWAKTQDFPARILNVISSANTAREIIIASAFDRSLLELVCIHAHQAAGRHAPGIDPAFLTADYSGHIVFCR